MKNFLLFLMLVLSATQPLYAQNVFPVFGNVGVGTTAPTSNMHILSNQWIMSGGSRTDPGLTIDNMLYKTEPHTPITGFDPNIMEIWQQVATGVTPPAALRTPVLIVKALNGFVGINTNQPIARLDINGNLHVQNEEHLGGYLRLYNEDDIFLRTGNDINHGLGWYGRTGRDAKI